MDWFQWAEMFRAIAYACGVLWTLYLCIEFSNQGDKALAGLFGTQSLWFGALLLTVSVRWMGLTPGMERALLTPAVLAHVAALGVVAWRRWFRKEAAPPV